MLPTHSLMPAHNLPTRQGSCLDHVALKIDRSKTSALVLVLNTSITDHSMTLLSLTRQNLKYKCSKTKKVINFDEALNSLMNENISELLFCNDPQLVTQILIDKINRCLTDNTREVKISKNQRIIKPWITPGLLRCIRNRNNIQKQLRANTGDEILKITFRRYRNFCNNLLKKIKRNYQRRLLQFASKTSKSLWKNIKNITHIKNNKSDSTKLLQTKSSSQESVDYVNNFFADIGKNLANAITQKMGDKIPKHNTNCYTTSQSLPSLSSFAMLDTDPEEVHTILMGLKSDSAPGWDGIPSSFLKVARKEIVPVISHLANLCFTMGVFPALLKIAIITPVHKSGDRDDVNNYRPISVLPSLSKILEKLINNRLINYLDKYKILSDYQYGFRKGKSTQDAVLSITSKIIDQLDNKGKCLTVFLDLKKAFDTVSVPILVNKLEKIGIRGTALQLLGDYLSERRQRVKIEQTVSDVTSISYGVPQGSVLGPTLFLIYINELCNIELDNTQVVSYADDTAVVFTGKSWDTIKIAAEKGLASISNWLESNLLTLNTAKTNFMCFSIYNNSQPDSSYNIKIHNCTNIAQSKCTCPAITKVSFVKYLGVIIDQRLSWHSQIEALAGRLRKLIWIFKTLRHVTDKNLLNKIYIALAQSLIIYCITVWGGALKTKFIEVERAQRILLKVMYFKKRTFSTRELYHTSNLLSIRQLYILHVILKKHTTLKFDISILNKRRKDVVAKSLPVRTLFAQIQYPHQSSHLFNTINKELEIYFMSYHECKKSLTKWLKSLEYCECEKLLEYNKF
ncbi:hypothetical protein JYU34_004157 [Plutella xylostella]|uniref:Reverse transcriptase domain-containing protein n=1 Tax=Plutella xylostella TaxID=51655 RepID=A0ABQ7QX87_PLUXY|nr:hypothetical protein JYU34_004157 [Plutella xylostella]